MIDEENFKKVILEYLPTFDQNSQDYASFSSLYQKMVEDSAFPFPYNAPDMDSKSYLSSILERMGSEGLVEGMGGDRGNELRYRTARSAANARLPIDPSVAEDQQGEDANASIWAELKRVRINAHNAAVVNSLIHRALDHLSASDRGNEAVMQAAAYLRAAQELVNAPDPPSMVIWDYIQKAAAIAGLLQLFAMIFSQATL